MLSPVWKHNKVYCISYIVWDCIQSPLSTMLYVYLMQISIDQLSENVGLPVVITTILLFLLCELLLHIGSDLLFSLYFEPCQARIIAKINLEICHHIKHTDYRYFDDPLYYDEYTVSYSNYANKSIETFMNVSSALAVIVTVGTLVGYILSSTIYILIITVISVFVKVWVSRRVNKIEIQHEEERAPINRRTDYYRDTLCSREAAMDLKCTNIYNILFNHYEHSARQAINIDVKFNKKLSFWSSIQTLSSDGSSAIIRTIICGLIVMGKVGVGSFVSLVSAANSLAWKIQGISKYYTKLDKSALYGKKIKHFINQTSHIELTNANNSKISDNKAFSIDFKDVCFNYENNRFSLQDINIKINKGEKIAIVGENGGGKSTLTKLLLRLYDPTSGIIFINGIDLKEYELQSYRSNVGIAFQESPVYSFSLRNNLSAYDELIEIESLGYFSKTAIDEILIKSEATLDTDITKKFTKDGIMLSGGERQKLAVSRLFVKNFGLLVFDEPTSALDPLAEEKLNQMIFDKANTTTTILISHRLSNVVNADCIYVMKDGKIIEHGSHNELLEKNGAYCTMFKLQAKNYQDA